MVQPLQLLDVTTEQILPQRPPFVMIDKLVEYESMSAATEFTVRQNNIFLSNGELLAAGMIENLAQTCAARLGYYNLISGLPVKIGYIGAINNLKILRTPKIGEVVRTRIVVEEELFGVTMVSGKSFIENEPIMEAKMKIVIK